MEERIKKIKSNEIGNGKYILYWMQESQRTRYNFALEEAIRISNQKQQPLYVVFNLMSNYPQAQKRHFEFMLQGLKNVEYNLERKKIRFILLEGNFKENILKISKEASVVVWDKSYLKFQIENKKIILNEIECDVYEVESNVLVPVEVVSMKEEYSAKTFRDKYNRIKDKYIVRIEEEKYSVEYPLKDKLNEMNRSDRYLPKNFEVLDGGFIGGEDEALKRLENFLELKLKFYLEKGPDNEKYSKLSPYLHFGNISPLQICMKVIESSKFTECQESFLEELLIRRELAINFVYYNKNYDKWDGITYGWAYETLKKHLLDKRDYIYSQEKLEACDTHDKYWNSCQSQMVETGYMDGYMRMYWCKKILEWSETPQRAYEIAIDLNNKYFYDGRDPSSYTGVAWCFGKHDRAWKERAIFGKVRYMNSNGLERKFEMETYVKKYGR
ncbi:deoxyribodipyrimidine photo-lyase [uncultured Cetobacterium sp.]|uniref:deoxyribodipyrimidine photo-lyase n=1 Tax=uncultured Cetobacterium sp. TaxID=527638 RepID=UPI00261AF715|nr:deoxyribodipyrimidine photo-lyase [uncultured Cetobacterium sp.]